MPLSESSIAAPSPQSALPKPAARRRGVLASIWRFLASLQLACVSLVVLGATLVCSTWLEVVLGYTPKQVRFAVYDRWWFSALLTVLGINVFCAAAIRFPWTRRQTGFVITHVGILVLMFGCVLTRWYGIDSQIYVLEKHQSHRVYKDTLQFVLREVSYGEGRGADKEQSATVHTQLVPFASGPFNWEEYAGLPWFPWQTAPRDRGERYNEDAVRLEVLDYLADSDLVAAKPLKLGIDPASAGTPGKPADGAALEVVELAANPAAQREAEDPRAAPSNRHRFADGREIVYWAARDAAETRAFLEGLPEGRLGEKGQIVLCVAGEKHVFRVDELVPRRRMPLGDSGLTVELLRAAAEGPEAQLRVRSPDGAPQPMLLAADRPEENQHDYRHGVYGVYWVDGKSAWAKPREPRPSASRLEILQGDDGTLLYRAWKSPAIESSGPMPSRTRRLSVFADKPIVLEVIDYEPADVNGMVVRAVSWERQRKREQRRQGRRFARVRLTVDRNASEYWIEPAPLEIDGLQSGRPPVRAVAGRNRRVEIELETESFDLGFDVFVHRFERRLDPGTSMASHYASLIDLRAIPEKDDAASPGKPRGAALLRDVHLTLNEPLDYRDAKTGRSYRFFQEGFEDVGPSPEGASPGRPNAFVSILSVNHDPGRGAKYLGSLLVVAGVFVMFRMRAYMFKRRPAGESASTSVVPH